MTRLSDLEQPQGSLSWIIAALHALEARLDEAEKPSAKTDDPPKVDPPARLDEAEKPSAKTDDPPKVDPPARLDEAEKPSAKTDDPPKVDPPPKK